MHFVNMKYTREICVQTNLEMEQNQVISVIAFGISFLVKIGGGLVALSVAW